MVLPVLGSSSAIAGSANKLLFDVLYQLQKDAGKVLIVTALSAVAPTLSRMPIKSSTVILGALALAASLVGALLAGSASIDSIEKGMVRGGGAALLLAVALLVVALIEHLRPRTSTAIVLDEAPRTPPSWQPFLEKMALPVGAVAAVGVPAVALARRRASIRQRRREETQRELSVLQRDVKRALALLTRLSIGAAEGTLAGQ